MVVHRIVGIFALTLGVLGVAGCAAGAYGVWLVASRLDRANDKLFDAVDRGLGYVQDRVPVVQQRVRDSTITTTEITEAVRGWSAMKVQDRIVAELEIERRAANLSGRLETAELRLDASAEAVLDVRRVMELGRSLGARVDPDSTDDVLAQLALLQDKVQQAEQAIDDVRKLALPSPGVSIEDRLARIAKILARILLTLSDIDRRLGNFAVRLSELRADARQLNTRTSRYILFGSVACYGLLAWVAAAQCALCSWGWRRWHRGHGRSR